MKKFLLVFAFAMVLGAVYATVAYAHTPTPNAYQTKDYYCYEVGWDAESQDYFRQHHVDCTFINVLVNGEWVLHMHAKLPKEGDICHKEIPSPDGEPPTFEDVACEYTYDDWVAAGSPSQYEVENYECLANFLFILNGDIDFDQAVWGTSVNSFSQGGVVYSRCEAPIN